MTRSGLLQDVKGEAMKGVRAQSAQSDLHDTCGEEDSLAGEDKGDYLGEHFVGLCLEGVYVQEWMVCGHVADIEVNVTTAWVGCGLCLDLDDLLKCLDRGYFNAHVTILEEVQYVRLDLLDGLPEALRG